MNKLIYFCLGALVLLTLLPIFNATFFQLHDFTHVARVVEMDQSIKDGHFPVRWTRDFAYGYGMPLFSFYGPLPSYITEGFHLVGFDAITSVKLFMIAMSLMGTFGMYELAQRFFGKAGGAVSAIAFTFVPYHALDLFVRGAFNELLALCILPWILVGIVELHRKQTTRLVAVTAFLLCAFFFSHNLMTMMFVPVLIAFTLLQLPGTKHKKAYLLGVGCAMLLAVLGAASFILPSFLEKNYTQVDTLIGGYSYYKYHFLYIRQFFTGTWGYGGSILGLEDGVSFSFGWVMWILAAAGTISWVVRKRKKPRDAVLPIGVLFMTGVAFFMTTFKSTPIWDAVPLIVYFQFPWRFLSVPMIFLPFFAGAIVFAMRGHTRRALLVVATTIVFIVFNLQYFKPVALLDDPNAMYYSDKKLIQQNMSGILPDYIPSSMKEIQPPFLSPFELDVEDAQIKVLVDRTQEKLLSFATTKPGSLLIRIAWFPNWTVYDHNEKIPYTVDEKSGFMRVSLQPGEHVIGVRLEDTPLRTASNLLSLLGLGGIVGLYFYGQHRRD